MTDEQPPAPETASTGATDTPYEDASPDALTAADEAIAEARQAEQHLRDTAPDALDVTDDES